MTAVTPADDAYAWRWSEEHTATTLRLIDTAIAAMRDGQTPAPWLLWGVTGLSESEQRRYFPHPNDLIREVRDRVAREVIGAACVDAAGHVRALTTWNVSAALVDRAFSDRLLYRALVHHGLIEQALEPVAIVAATFRTFPRLTVHTDSLFRRAAHVAVIRAVIDQALDLQDSDRSRYDLVEILDSFLIALITATAAS